MKSIHKPHNIYRGKLENQTTRRFYNNGNYVGSLYPAYSTPSPQPSAYFMAKYQDIEKARTTLGKLVFKLELQEQG